MRLHFDTGVVYYEDLKEHLDSWQDPTVINDTNGIESTKKPAHVGSRYGKGSNILGVNYDGVEALVGYKKAPTYVTFDSDECIHAYDTLQSWVESTPNILPPIDILENRITYPSYPLTKVADKITIPAAFQVIVYGSAILPHHNSSNVSDVTGTSSITAPSSITGDSSYVSLRCHPHTTVMEVVTAAIKKFQVQGHSINTSLKCIIKMTGFEDYLIDYNRAICSYEYVLRSLRGFHVDTTVVKLNLLPVTDEMFEMIKRRVEYDTIHGNEPLCTDLCMFDCNDTVTKAPIEEEIQYVKALNVYTYVIFYKVI